VHRAARGAAAVDGRERDEPGLGAGSEGEQVQAHRAREHGRRDAAERVLELAAVGQAERDQRSHRQYGDGK
jgi:hypothetical protein